ncbi:phosphoadenosine phosphosulfate reductase family protein [Clostridium sp. DJ247]|uniref:phosphoadenosine phosphosulfate reductase domain-containing protein n=1 Tax=Clostridium sp. DJ247 TaxID=2726188 RepID=UPI00162753FC|nr:phosphoadenosine phosphosulfate reductase family protein [Clostridium sp. DJ247]MBC2580390.1 phosphoadenosine phosphosulfate reductase family protein [Clostridium sp. DJ247]
MSRCKKCVMPVVEDKITLDQHGVCNVCNDYNEFISNEKNQTLIKRDKEVLLKKIEMSKGKDSKYDCMVGVSGGKDSLMTLYIAKKELNLNPLAVFIDNGFGLPEMYENNKNAADILGVDLLIYRSNVYQKIFKYLLATKKPIYYCRLCHSILDLHLREIARQNSINMILGGYTKGQEYLKHTELFSIYKISDENVNNELAKNDEFSEIAEVLKNSAVYFYKNFGDIKTLSPFSFIDYNEANIIELLKKELKFKMPAVSWPKDSTNCFFNFVSQKLAVDHFGFSQHEVELSTLVRRNEMTRERALELVNTEISEEYLQISLDKLGYKYSELI